MAFTHGHGGRRGPARASFVGVLAFATLLISFLGAARAEAFIYWANGSASAIGRANLNGKGVDQSFVPGVRYPDGVAVDAKHIYWSQARGGIGRARLDGTHDLSLIKRTDPLGVAVDDKHLYWSWSDCEAGCTIEQLESGPPGGIGRARLDGTHVEQDFISGVDARHLAVDAEHIYWTGSYCDGACGTPWSELPPPVQAIGRANLDGSGVERGFVSTPGGFGGLAVDAKHIYWTGGVSDSFGRLGAALGRANLDGTGVEPTFIGGATGDHPPAWEGPAVDRDHIYWTNHGYFDSTVLRASLDGSRLETLIDPSEDFPFGALAVDALTDTRLAGRVTAPRSQGQGGARIVVRVKVKAKERLTVKATGRINANPTCKLKPKTVHVARGTTRTLKLRPTKKAKARKIARALERGKEARAKLAVKLSDAVGNGKKQKLRVRLKR